MFVKIILKKLIPAGMIGDEEQEINNETINFIQNNIDIIFII